MNIEVVPTEVYSHLIGQHNRKAMDGYVFMCAACGKKSRDMFGNDKIDYGWDESCVLNSVLIKENK